MTDIVVRGFFEEESFPLAHVEPSDGRPILFCMDLVYIHSPHCVEHQIWSVLLMCGEEIARPWSCVSHQGKYQGVLEWRDQAPSL